MRSPGAGAGAGNGGGMEGGSAGGATEGTGGEIKGPGEGTVGGCAGAIGAGPGLPGGPAAQVLCEHDLRIQARRKGSCLSLCAHLRAWELRRALHHTV